MAVRHLLAAGAVLALVTPTSAQGPVRLSETIKAGSEYHVSTRVELSGELTVPPEDLRKGPTQVALSGRSTIEYDERVLDTGTRDRPGPRTVRVYRRVDLERTVGDRPQDSTIRPAVRRMVILRNGHREVPFSP